MLAGSTVQAELQLTRRNGYTTDLEQVCQLLMLVMEFTGHIRGSRGYIRQPRK